MTDLLWTLYNDTTDDLGDEWICDSEKKADRAFYDKYITPLVNEDRSAGIDMEGGYTAALESAHQSGFVLGYEVGVKVLLSGIKGAIK